MFLIVTADRFAEGGDGEESAKVVADRVGAVGSEKLEGGESGLVHVQDSLQYSLNEDTLQKVPNKFVEIAKDYEDEFKRHLEKYKDTVFPSEKVRILEDALEKLIKCVVYLKKSINVQESRENFLKELEGVFDRENEIRSAIIMAIFARNGDKPADLRAIARWVYGTDDRAAVEHVRKVVRAFVDFGILDIADENPLRVLPSRLYASLMRKRFLAGIFEAAEKLIVR